MKELLELPDEMIVFRVVPIEKRHDERLEVVVKGAQGLSVQLYPEAAEGPFSV
jgi:hypothetical protein